MDQSGRRLCSLSEILGQKRGLEPKVALPEEPKNRVCIFKEHQNKRLASTITLLAYIIRKGERSQNVLR